MNQRNIGIIGGGAAGLMTAVLLARKGFAVTILEKNDKIGKKLLITGNGRCNLTNRYAAAKNYFSRSQNIAADLLERFPVEKALEIFESMGITARELEKGKMYPYSLEAKTVVKAFLYELEHLGVRIIYQANVKRLEKQRNWLVTYEQKIEPKAEPVNKKPDKRKASNRSNSPNSGEIMIQTKKISFDKVILCTGGMSYAVSGSDGSGYELAKKLGHKVISPIPAIVQLVMNEKTFPYYKHLQGTKTEAKICLCDSEKALRTETGELLFTAYGVSGPPILLLSTAAAYAQGKPLKLKVNFFPEMPESEVFEFIEKKVEAVPHLTVEHMLEMIIPNRLIGVLLKRCGMAKDQLVQELHPSDIKKIVDFLTSLELEVDKPYQWQQAQVTAGGISCQEVFAETLESKKARDLYFAGEVLDIDGDCGGFNLQWAWSSAMAIAEAMREKES